MWSTQLVLGSNLCALVVRFSGIERVLAIVKTNGYKWNN